MKTTRRGFLQGLVSLAGGALTRVPGLDLGPVEDVIEESHVSQVVELYTVRGYNVLSGAIGNSSPLMLDNLGLTWSFEQATKAQTAQMVIEALDPDETDVNDLVVCGRVIEHFGLLD